MKSIHQDLFGRIRSWVHIHHTATYAMAGAGIVLAAGIVATVVLFQPPKQMQHSTPKPTPSVQPVVYYSPLTGNKVTDEASTKQAVTAIMLENSPDARPQSGLKEAGVVYEAIAEGGITRFLAVYQESKPRLIGPVRSLRMYYVDWLAPYQPTIAHIGGSKFALDEVRNGKYRDIDQFFNASTYWRANDRYAPHNVYTNFERLDELNRKKGYTNSTFTSWPRTDAKPVAEPNATIINVTISGPLFNSSYAYDNKTNTYIRSQAGAPHTDREAGQITPSTVIVMDTTMVKSFEDGWREQITTTGNGKARIFQNGTVIEATWSKKDRGSQIKFTDQSGKEVELVRGQTWITAVPANQRGGVSWK